MIDRINYAALKVGDPMFLAEGNGWSSYRVTEYTEIGKSTRLNSSHK